jgi:hypothetical protein
MLRDRLGEQFAAVLQDVFRSSAALRYARQRLLDQVAAR